MLVHQLMELQPIQLENSHVHTNNLENPIFEGGMCLMSIENLIIGLKSNGILG